jgi:hypothetical protein
MSLWTTNFGEDSTLKDPKRNFRFRITITGLSDDAGTGGSGIVWYAKTAEKPSYTINSVEHKYLGHTFHYPGTVTWNEVTIAVVDPQEPDVAGILAGKVEEGGYVIPATTNVMQTISKAKMVSSLQSVLIEQIDAEGNPIESWTLWNAFITNVTHGTLDYSNDELTEYTIQFRYDWARLETPTSDHFNTTS